MLEEVVILDNGRLVTQSPVDALRGRGASIVGPAAAVDEFTAGFTVLAEQRLGGTKSTTVLGDLDPDAARAGTLGRPRDRPGRAAGSLRPSDRHGRVKRRGDEHRRRARHRRTPCRRRSCAGLHRLRQVLRAMVVGLRPMLRRLLARDAGRVPRHRRSSSRSLTGGLDHSMWDYGTQSPKYFSMAIGITLTPAYLSPAGRAGRHPADVLRCRKHLSHRRRGRDRAVVGAGLPGASALLYSWQGWPQTLQPTRTCSPGTSQVGLIFAEFFLLILSHEATGWLLGITFVRFGFWRGLLLLPLSLRPGGGHRVPARRPMARRRARQHRLSPSATRRRRTRPFWWSVLSGLYAGYLSAATDGTETSQGVRAWLCTGGVYNPGDFCGWLRGHCGRHAAGSRIDRNSWLERVVRRWPAAVEMSTRCFDRSGGSNGNRGP